MAIQSLRFGRENSLSSTARDDVDRQFRYYLIESNAPQAAVHFRQALRLTAEAIRAQPHAAPRYLVRNPKLQKLPSWPIAGFKALRFYFIIDTTVIRVIRVLHGKRNVRKILEQEKP